MTHRDLRGPLFFALCSAIACATAGCGQSVAAGPINAEPLAELAAGRARSLFALSDARTLGHLFAMSNPDASEASRPGPCETRAIEGDTVVIRARECAANPGGSVGEIRFRGDPLSSAGSFMEYRNWRTGGEQACMGSVGPSGIVINGTSRVTARGSVREFALDLVIDGLIAGEANECPPSRRLAISYRGSLDFFDSHGPSRRADASVRASGAGLISIAGVGRVESRTTGLVFDPAVCATEPSSGTLEIRGARVVVLTYDGAARCGGGPERTAPFTLDGVAAGELNVALCSVRAAGAGRFGVSGAGALAAGAIVFGRRRRARAL
ncbi:MAG: hypothetical protein JNK05_04075 [Myxococcales bacterium]|nr:hypothetical protein [Myxococcales bacterium]